MFTALFGAAAPPPAAPPRAEPRPPQPAPAAPAEPPPPPAPPKRVPDGPALAARVVAAYDDNGDGALDYAELCAHKADLGDPRPPEDQFRSKCADRGFDPTRGFPAAFLADLLARVTEEQEAALVAALDARDAEIAAFATLFARPVYLSGYLQQDVAGYLTTGPVRRWARLDGGRLHLGNSPLEPPMTVIAINPRTAVEENVDAGRNTLRISGSEETVVFGGHSPDDHRLWGLSLSLAVAKANPDRRLPKHGRERFAQLLGAVPDVVPALTAPLPEAVQPPRLHGYRTSCTYRSVLGPNWKKRYCTLHRGWWSIREGKEDAGGLAVMPLRNATIENDAAEPNMFSVQGPGYQGVSPWRRRPRWSSATGRTTSSSSGASTSPSSAACSSASPLRR